ncbi:MAG: DUF4783 domain-containing protein [Taibaiella sp.]
MKKYLALLITSIFMWGAVIAQPQLDDVIQALNSGDLENMVKYFDNVVDITLNNDQSTYSKTQAEMVIKSFLTKNSAKSFQVRYKGNVSGDSSFFVIGELKSNAHGIYKVYFFFKQKGKLHFIQKIKFEQ